MRIKKRVIAILLVIFSIGCICFTGCKTKEKSNLDNLIDAVKKYSNSGEDCVAYVVDGYTIFITAYKKAGNVKFLIREQKIDDNTSAYVYKKTFEFLITNSKNNFTYNYDSYYYSGSSLTVVGRKYGNFNATLFCKNETLIYDFSGGTYVDKIDSVNLLKALIKYADVLLKDCGLEQGLKPFGFIID